MKKLIELKNGENVISVDCQNEKVYFNGNEVLKISMNYDGGVLTPNPYEAIGFMACVSLSQTIRELIQTEVNNTTTKEVYDALQDPNFIESYIDNDFEFYALTYKDSETNKEHFVVDDGSEWRECGCGYDSIDGWHKIPDYEECEFNEYVVAYGRNEGKEADAIVMLKPSLYYNTYYNE